MIRIMHVHHHELVMGHRGEGQGILVLGNDRMPLRWHWMRQVNGDNAAPGCLKIGVEIKNRIDIAQEDILRIRLIQQADERASTVHGTIVEPIGPSAVLPDVEHQVCAVVSNAWGET
jgi:hypothetical protein